MEIALQQMQATPPTAKMRISFHPVIIRENNDGSAVPRRVCDGSSESPGDGVGDGIEGRGSVEGSAAGGAGEGSAGCEVPGDGGSPERTVPWGEGVRLGGRDGGSGWGSGFGVDDGRAGSCDVLAWPCSLGAGDVTSDEDLGEDDDAVGDNVAI
eukprot:2654858-Rhodomonas_salina.4